MDVQKYIDKMVLVPIERWNQLLDIEQKTSEKSEEQVNIADDIKEEQNSVNTRENESIQDVENENENENMSDYPPPPPPGIPMNASDNENVTQQKPKKRKLQVKSTGKTIQNKYRKKETHMNGWLSLP